MALIYTYQNRTIEKDIIVLDADGNAVIPSASDEVRVIIGRVGEVAKLTVATNAPTVNGSTITKATLDTNGKNRVRLDNADLAAIDPGVYTFFVDYWDSSDSDWKMVDRQVFFVEETT